jgi:hypothetical protein
MLIPPSGRDHANRNPVCNLHRAGVAYIQSRAVFVESRAATSIIDVLETSWLTMLKSTFAAFGALRIEGSGGERN